VLRCEFEERTLSAIDNRRVRTDLLMVERDRFATPAGKRGRFQRPGLPCQNASRGLPIANGRVSLDSCSRCQALEVHHEKEPPEMNYQQQSNPFFDVFARARTRQSWNDRLAHWEKPASDSEEAMIERAASAIRKLMPRNAWLTNEGVQIAPQGSYYNNTNVRQESDIDLRAVHPLIWVEYAPGVQVESANIVLGYSPAGRTFDQVVAQMRSEIAADSHQQPARAHPA